MTKLEAEIIIALADNNLRLTDAAKALFMHRTTVLYHVRKIHAITGKNPTNFYDMCKLLPKAQRILSGEVNITDQTRDALNEIGRMTHTEEDNHD